MLRFGVGLALSLAVLSGAAAIAQTTKPPGKVQPGVVPPAPERKSAADPAHVAPPPPDVWTPAEIEAAKAQCATALKGLNVLISYEQPIKDGECGNPAPIRLVRLDNVTFTPAALVNCGMLAPLHQWITKDLQPLAKRQLGAKITKIEVMSDYSCRTAFGRVGKKLSQHAYVDALDIRGFTTEKNQEVVVLEGWGPTDRDVAAAKAREEQIVETAQAAAAKSAPAGGSETSPAGEPATISGNTLKPTHAGVDAVTAAILPGGTKRQQLAARLGGPPEKATAAHKPEKKQSAQKQSPAAGQRIASLSRAATAALARPTDSPDARFLRQAHAAACHIFGTTLGPEANEMHRNHFHVDMAERKIKKICD